MTPHHPDSFLYSSAKLQITSRRSQRLSKCQCAHALGRCVFVLALPGTREVISVLFVIYAIMGPARFLQIPGAVEQIAQNDGCQ